VTRGRPETPVILLSGVRWDFLWQRHHEIAARLATRGHQTVFVETTGLSNPRPERGLVRKLLSRLARSMRSMRATGREPETGIPENLSVHSPLVAPPTARMFRRLNQRIFVPRVVRDLRRISEERPAVIAYPPTRTTLDLVRMLSPRRLFYDCSDDYENFPRVPQDIAETERELLALADAVSCTSDYLLEKVRLVRPDAYLSGPGVDFQAFNALAASYRDGGPVREIETVCFFGHIGERLDLEALREAARAGFTVRLVGEVVGSARWLLDEPGVEYRGTVTHRELPGALEGVDAFVLPYRLSGQGLGIAPAKTFECLATGIPVVASPLPALAGLAEHVYLAESPTEFVRVLGELPDTETWERIAARTELARENDWERRVDEIERALGLVE
jgi:glycosyltransferase involved in cell wall biosynthesis